MPRKEEKFRLIEELTTYKNDYQFWRIHREVPEPKKIVKPVVEKPRPPPIQIDNQTHSPYNPEVYIPFDLFIEPRPIIDLDPNEKFEMKKSPAVPRCGKTKKMKLSLSPGICLEDIEDDDVHKTVLGYTYASTSDGFKFSALPVTKRPNPPNTVVINDQVKFTPKKFKFDDDEEDKKCCCENDDDNNNNNDAGDEKNG